LASVIASVLIPLIGEAIANKISPKKWSMQCGWC
jgi:hypothetical protein